MHTPDIEAAKCWSGNLGNIATHAVVYAQLYIGDECYGLHSFVVPIRDPVQHRPFPGITVGDMGEKIGQNGLANGYACMYVCVSVSHACPDYSNSSHCLLGL